VPISKKKRQTATTLSAYKNRKHQLSNNNEQIT